MLKCSFYMHLILRYFIFVGFAFGLEALAVKTNFMDPHRGLSIGMGTYARSLYSSNIFDPVPALNSSGTTPAGTEDYYLLPAKMGYFREFGVAIFETYFRYMLNSSSPWTATGSSAGDGNTLFKSKGLGVNAGIMVANSESVRLNLTFNAEYMFQTAEVSFTPTGGVKSTLILKSSSFLFGGGLQPELWLGDLWVLSTLVAFQYGYPSATWKANNAATIMGSAYTAGAITDPETGTAAKANFGGLLIEVGLKLNFQ